MSGYVEALERWQSDTAPPIARTGVSAAGGEAELRLQLPAGTAGLGRVIAFAGICGHERAGDVAASYAEMQARQGASVLLVDLAPAPELSDRASSSLEQSLAVDESLVGATGVSRRIAGSTAEIRSRDFEARLQAWLTSRAAEVDRIVVHVGPVLSDSRALAMAVAAKSAVLVTRAHWTSRADLQTASERLRRAGAKVEGAVLYGATRVPNWLERVLRLLPRRAGGTLR